MWNGNIMVLTTIEIHAHNMTGTIFLEDFQVCSCITSPVLEFMNGVLCNNSLDDALTNIVNLINIWRKNIFLSLARLFHSIVHLLSYTHTHTRTLIQALTECVCVCALELFIIIHMHEAYMHMLICAFKTVKKKKKPKNTNTQIRTNWG